MLGAVADSSAFYDRLMQQQENVAAPEGLRQERAAQAEEVGPQGLGDALRPWTRDNPFQGSPAAWLGGRNIDGTNNGWSTDFTAKMFESRNAWDKKVAESRQSDDPREWLSFFDYFDRRKNPGATGVATWNDPKRGIRAGDVYLDGQKQQGQNLYDVFDKPTADLLIGQFMFNADEEKRIYSDSDPVSRLSRAVEERVEESSRQAEMEPSALRFQADVYREQEGLVGEGKWDPTPFKAVTMGGSALGTGLSTAAAWAAIGGAGGPGGVIAAGAAGFLAGLGSAWLNQDQLSNMWAETIVRSDRASVKYNGLVQGSSWLEGASRQAYRMISPLSNLTQGAADAAYSDIGDLKEGFYAVDPETGERLASGLWQAADIAATLGDSFLQFGSKAGATVYMTQMSGTILGNLGMMTSGAGFNQRMGDWDEYEGSQWLYAIGSVAIDALQLGMARGIVRKAGEQARAFSTKTGEGMVGRGDKFKPQTLSANYFTFEGGKVATRRTAWSTVIVPSEFIQWMSVGRRARQFAHLRQRADTAMGGAKPAAMTNRGASASARKQAKEMLGKYVPSPDDYYKAALELAHGRTFREALVNGWGEGVEEAVQSFLEPRSFGERASGQEIAMAALYGFASGVGMSMGPVVQGAEPDQIQEWRAMSLFMMRTGATEQDMTQEFWDSVYRAPGMTDRDRRRMAIADPEESVKIGELMEGFRDLQRFEMMGSEVAMDAYMMLGWNKYVELMKRRNPNIKGSQVVMGRGSALVAPNGAKDPRAYTNLQAVTSMEQLARNLRQVWDSREVRLEAAQEGLAAAQSAVLIAREQGRDADVVQLEEQVKKWEKDVRVLGGGPGGKRMRELQDEAIEMLTAEIDEYLRLRANGDAAGAERSLDMLNEALLLGYKRQWVSSDGTQLEGEEADAVFEVTALPFMRHPSIDAGSIQHFAAAASTLLTDLRTGAAVFITQDRLTTLNADHDGDQLVLQTDLVVPEERKRQLLRGAQFLTTEVVEEPLWKRDARGAKVLDDNGLPVPSGETIKRTKIKVNVDPADGNLSRASVYSGALNAAGTDRSTIVWEELGALLREFAQRYDAILDREALADVLISYAKAVRDGDPKAESLLLDGIWNIPEAVVPLLERADDTGQAEVLWQKERLALMDQGIHRRLARQGAAIATPRQAGARVPQSPPGESDRGESQARRRGTSIGFTLSALLEYTTEPTRQSQATHYAFFSSAVSAAELRNSGMNLTDEQLQRYVEHFAAQANKMRSDLDAVTEKFVIESTVQGWLEDLLRQARRDFPQLSELKGVDALLMIANLAVVDIEYDSKTGMYSPRRDKSGKLAQTSMVQLLLKKALITQIKELQRAGIPDSVDDPQWKKVHNLMRLTRPAKDHSSTAMLALMEVFGDRPLAELSTDAAAVLGGQVTMRQLVGRMMAMGDQERRAYRDQLKTAAHIKRGIKYHDGPNFIDEYIQQGGEGDRRESPTVTGFTMIVKAVIAESNSAAKRMVDQNKTISGEVRRFFASVFAMRDSWMKTPANYERVMAQAEELGISREKNPREFNRLVLRDMIAMDQTVSLGIASIIPDSVKPAVFQIRNGEFWQARWVEDIFLSELNPDKAAERAEKELFNHLRFAEVNLAGGRAHMEKLIEAVASSAKDKTEVRDEFLNGLDETKLNSRFGRMMVELAGMPDGGLLLSRLLRIMQDADSLETQMDAINADPALRGAVADLLPYFDDASAYEPKLDAVWAADMPSQLYREVVQDAAKMLDRRSIMFLEVEQERDAEDSFTGQLYRHLQLPPGERPMNTEISDYADKLVTALERAQLMGDTPGWGALEQFLVMVSQGDGQFFDKGSPTEESLPLGDMTATMFGLGGYGSGISQETAAMTARDWDAVKTNLSGLSKEPVRIQLNDGRYVMIDFSTVESVAEMLANPITRAFAKAVVFPTVREVTPTGQMALYRRAGHIKDGRQSGYVSVRQLLEGVELGHLQPDDDLKAADPARRGALLSLAQAEEYVGRVDGILTEQAMRSSDPAARVLGVNPIRQMITEFVVAYRHSETNNDTPDEVLASDVTRMVASVLQQMAAYYNNSNQDMVDMLRKSVEAMLQARFSSNSLPAEFLTMSDEVKEVLRAGLITSFKERMLRETRAIDLLELSPAFQALPADHPDRAALARRVEMVKKAGDQVARNPDSVFEPGAPILPPSAEGSLKYWLGPLDDQDPQALAQWRLSILGYLRTGGRINKFQAKKEYVIYSKVMNGLLDDKDRLFQLRESDDADWRVLAELAANLMVQQAAAPETNSVGLVRFSADDAGAAIRALHDTSYSYASAPMFDEQVLQAAVKVNKAANFNPNTITGPEMLDVFLSSLYREDRLAPWTARLPQQTIMAREALRRSTTLADLQRHGILPMELRDLIGAVWADVSLAPEEAHMTDAEIDWVVQADGPLRSFEESARIAGYYVPERLDYHFFDEITVTDPNGRATTISVYDFDPYMLEDGPGKLGYRVFRADRMQDLLESQLVKLAEEIEQTGNQQLKTTGKWQIDIHFVDVKKKPNDPRYFNSIYFDGVGRSGAHSIAPGPVADMFFGVGADSQRGQQIPLNAANEANATFWQIPTTGLEQVLEIERDLFASGVESVILRKATIMFRKEYETGPREPGDFNAIYKMLKSRHVVRIKDADGEWEYMWAEEAIAREKAGPLAATAFDIELIPLSSQVHMALLGQSGGMGSRYAVTAPELNIRDTIPQPQLTKAYLESLGLERLGDVAQAGNTREIASVSELPLYTAVSRGHGTTTVEKFKDQVVVLHGRMVEAHTVRRMEGSIGMPWEQMLREQNPMFQLMQETIRRELEAPMLARATRVPFMDTTQMTEAAVAERVERIMGRKMGPHANIYHYQLNTLPNPGKGVITKSSVQSRFADIGKQSVGNIPVLGDLAIIDLDNIRAGTDDLDAAIEEAMLAVEAFADTGATIALIGAASGLLRAEVANEINKGALGYRSFSGSNHFFVPSLQKRSNRDMLESGFTEIRDFTARTTQLMAVSDAVGVYGGNENATLTNLELMKRLRFERVQNTLLPTQMTKIDDDSSTWMLWGLPQTDTQGGTRADSWEVVSNRLAVMFETGGFEDHLLKLFGGDPSGVEIAVQDSDGKWGPGVLSMQQAVEMFKETINNNKYPIERGGTLLPGQIVPVVTSKGDILLTRYGFKLPDRTILDQLKTPLGGDGPSNDGTGLGVAVAVNKLQEQQTVPAPMLVDDYRPSRDGLVVRGRYDLGIMTKLLLEQTGYKAGLTFAPANLELPGSANNRPLAQRGRSLGDLEILLWASQQSVHAKQSTYGQIRDFRWLLALTGFNMEQHMIRFLFGDWVARDTSSTEYFRARNTMLDLLKKWADEQSMLGSDVVDLLNSNQILELFAGFAARYAESESDAMTNFVDFSRRQRQTAEGKTATARLGEVIVASLMAPGITVQSVLGSQGLATVTKPDSLITLIPPVMNEGLMNPAYSDLWNMLMQEANDRLNSVPADNGAPVYKLNNDFTFNITVTGVNPDGSKQDERWEGVRLQLIQPIGADADEVTLTASQISQQSGVSPHVATVFAEAAGAMTAARPRIKPDDFAWMFRGNDNLLFFDDPNQSFYNLFSRVTGITRNHSPYARRFPAQQVFVESASRERMSYEMPIDWVTVDKDGKETPWSPEVAIEVKAFLDVLGLGVEFGHHVDTLVRQMLGRPGSLEQDGRDRIEEGQYRRVLAVMKANVEKGMHPLDGGMVFMPMHSFWQAVYAAQRTRPEADKWRPMMDRMGAELSDATSWDQWVKALMGQILESDAEMRPEYSLAINGFWHTYQGAIPDWGTIPLALETEVDMKLVDKETNEYLLAMDPGNNALFSDPVIFDHMAKTVNVLTGHETDSERLPGESRSYRDAPLEEQVRRLEAWAKKKDIPTGEKISVAEYYRKGAKFVETGSNTQTFFMYMNQLQIMNRLFNGGIFVSGFIEVPFRNMFENITDVFGGAYHGAGSMKASRFKDWFNSSEKTASIVAGLEKAGIKITPRYSLEQRVILDELAEVLSSRVEWRAHVFGEMVYKDLARRMPANRLGQAVERVNTQLARTVSDPYLGMRPKTAALRYLYDALEYMERTDTDVSLEQLVEGLMRDPLWLQKRTEKSKQAGFGTLGPDQVGLNGIARARGTKQTLLNEVTLQRIDKLERSGNVAGQFLGFLLNIPFRFKRFNVGTMLQILGLDAIDQAIAMMRDQRPARNGLGRLQLNMRGDIPGPVEFTDYSEILDGVDLSRAFAKSGSTQAILLAAGMFAGHLGLDGEDEEAKKRRLQAKYLNAPLWLDPRRAENDFLFADALFFDSVGWFKEMFKDGEGPDARPYIMPHWIMRQFTSPVMGVQRFFNTGNPMEIWWGARDAIGAIPYSVESIISDAAVTTSLLLDGASEEMSENGYSPSAMDMVTRTLLGVGIMTEKALFENAWFNAMRVGKDQFDRDPYAAVKIAEDTGNIAKNPDGTPMRDTSLVTYREDGTEMEPGQTREAYVDRPDDWSLSGARSHGYAENNLTFSIVASLLTGQVNFDSTFARRNMAVKERKIEVEEATKAEVETLVMAAYRSMGGMENLTLEEITKVLVRRNQLADTWQDEDSIQAEAEAMYAVANGEYGAFSLMDEDGYEIIQKPGQYAVFKALYYQQIHWDDAVLDGVYASQEVRDEIAVEWLSQLKQESIDLGLSDQAANYRVRRIWYGDDANPNNPGLKKILYDNRIPSNPTRKYRQLNLMYAIGPDGMPVATPFKKQSVLRALGIPLPILPPAAGVGMSKDERGKSVDDIAGINTGLHGLVQIPHSSDEGVKGDDKIVDSVLSKTFQVGGEGGTGTGFRRYYRGGGGGGYSSSGYFSPMRALPGGTSPRIDTTPAINTSNPYTRRANVNRQRIWFERGRLKEWQ
jgi:hypothetical protein